MNRIEKMTEVVLKGGKVLRRMRGTALKLHDKKEQRGAHFATSADHSSQKVILQNLSKDFPKTPILAEEGEMPTTLEPYRFDVDPLDGTTNYTNHCPENGVIIADIEGHEPVRGVIYLPHHNVLITAEKGHGCYIGTATKPHLSKIWLPDNTYPPLDKCEIAADFAPWILDNTKTSTHGVLSTVIVPLLKEGFVFRSIMCSAYAIYELLMGRTIAYINLGIAKTWDLSAGTLMIKEAGGFVTGPRGEKLVFNKLQINGVFAAHQKAYGIVLPHTKAWREANLKKGDKQ